MFVKNLKINIQLWIALVVLTLLFIVICFECPEHTFDILIGLAFIWLVLLPFCLIVPMCGLLYFVKVNNDGIKILFCNKTLYCYKWDDIKEISIKNPSRNGLWLKILLNNNKSCFISKTKKLEHEITKYYVGKIIK